MAFAMGMATVVALTNDQFPSRADMESAASRGPRKYYDLISSPESVTT
jgi:hypothetical protein